MKHVTRVLALLLSLLLVAGMSSTAFAVDDDVCTIRIFSGAQGSVPGGTVSNYTVKRGARFEAISSIAKYATVPAESKYYAKGLRESGEEEEHDLSFEVEKDEDFVVTYGIKGEQVTYRVRYVDANGNTLRASDGPFYANVGDRVYVAYIEISGYQPDAYNKAKTLTEDHTFVFHYTRIQPTPTGGGTTPAPTGGGVAIAGGAAANNPNANPNANANANPNANAANNQNANNPANNTPTQPVTPAAPVELIDEDEVPLAVPDLPGAGTLKVPNAPKVIEASQRTRLPNWALIAGMVLLVGLISMLYWYLLFYRKKKKYASLNDDYEILGFDDDQF